MLPQLHQLAQVQSILQLARLQVRELLREQRHRQEQQHIQALAGVVLQVRRLEQAPVQVLVQPPVSIPGSELVELVQERQQPAPAGRQELPVLSERAELALLSELALRCRRS